MISGNDLTDEQKQAVATWAEEGQSLGDIQNGLSKEFGIKCTYMNMHLLMIDLGVSLKEEEEPEPEPAPEPVPEPPPAAIPEPAPAPTPDAPPPAAPAPEAGTPPAEELPPAAEVNVQVSISEVAIPNTMASGSVTFSDGEIADWFVDQLGRLSLDPKTPGYQPDEANVIAFQQELQRLARSQGM